MKEKRITIIIGLMAFAVIGLVTVQVFWLINLIKVEEERFDRSVNNAMLASADKLEKKEAAKMLIEKVWVGANKSKTVKPREHHIAKNHFKYIIHDTTKTSRVIMIENDDKDLVYKFSTDSVVDNKISEVKVVSINGNTNMKVRVTAPRVVFEKKLDTFVTSKKRLVQNVVGEMIELVNLKPIEKRVSVNSLDSVLTQEFINKGINGEFQFGVLKVNKDSLALLKTGTDSAELNKTKYRTLLFPEEIFSGINELRVYFPNKNQHILSSVIGMLALSVGFIALIVYLFLKTVKMFIRQKKITDVKNDLINNITHEFKTPISTISLACEALNEPALLAEKQSVAKYSKIIRDENERLQLMVDTLLNTASMEKDELKIDKAQINVEEILTDVISKYDELIKQREATIEIINNSANCNILGDKFHLTNSLSNLIDNALKFNEQKPVIDIVLKDDLDKLILTIIDNGIGIAKDNLNKIFETFYRVQTGNIQNVRGNGIGLSYVKKIVELHNGTITVDSELNKGTTFKILLPKL